jgi:intraflagellar transport protein 172
MQLKHVKSVTQPTDANNKVTALCWAPNGSRLAVCTTDRVVQLFDNEGNRRDKFATKPAEKVSAYPLSC